MPRKGQKSVTLSDWIVEKVEQYYKENQNELAQEGVTSYTGLISRWLEDELREKDMIKSKP